MSHLTDTHDVPLPTTWWTRLDQWMDTASQKLNPILVKEARQALKSRQFAITFTLLLICGLVWTLLGVTLLMPGIYFVPSGAFMLTGYYFILTVPMLLIVPFSAYRSLAAEREDGTYELLSITTLSSRHIVAGKMGSAVLQMLVYYSALSPCIAFTYLLRGVDIVTIQIVLVHMFWVSMLLSSVGLVMATLSRHRHVQVFLSVALLIALLGVTLAWWMWTGSLIHYTGGFYLHEADDWVVQGVIVSLGCSYIALFVLGAASQLSFASDNRATRLRITMLAQQILFIGCMMYFVARHTDADYLYPLLGFAAAHWMVAGALMTGEWAQLSPRVKRSLPQSFLGRCFLTWFNPGSGTGYVFAVANMAALALLAAATTLVVSDSAYFSPPSRRISSIAVFGLLLCCYLTIYLGLGRLMLLWLRRLVHLPVLLPLIVHSALLGLGVAIPLFLQAWLQGFQGFRSYSELQITNWAWTLIESVDRNTDLTLAALMLLALAAAVFAVNLITTVREIEQVRQDVPTRVQADELERHPKRKHEEKRPVSPFDDR
jgi:hypothetical protein